MTKRQLNRKKLIHGGVKASTGDVSPDKRAAASTAIKAQTFKINDNSLVLRAA